jgi:hypothetical protein
VATRRNFTQVYKDQAVSLVLDSGRSIGEVAKARPQPDAADGSPPSPPPSTYRSARASRVRRRDR